MRTLRNQIYTQSDGNEVLVSDSVFASNFATERGGAICAVGTDLLTVGNCEFRNNEASFEGAGTGGDIYANSGATLAVESSVFFGSRAGYGGAAIDCCGAEITDCAFVDAKTVSTDVSARWGGEGGQNRTFLGGLNTRSFAASPTCLTSAFHGE